MQDEVLFMQVCRNYCVVILFLSRWANLVFISDSDLCHWLTMTTQFEVKAIIVNGRGQVSSEVISSLILCSYLVDILNDFIFFA